MRIKNATWTLGTGETVNKTRLFADAGYLLTQNGTDFFGCVDVDIVDGWYEVAEPEEE